jgi:phosphomevalonate kinase
MSSVDIRVPGKLFVIGEYAVLHGGRALVAAVDTGLRCRADRSRAWRLAAPDLGVDAELDGIDAASPGALLASAIVTARDELGVAGPLAFHVRGTQTASCGKYGLGGSAASVVAILAAAAAMNGMDLVAARTRAQLFSTAFAVHRRHQRGRGSGADVAASVYGGWLDYALAEGGSRIAPATRCAPMRLAAVWSGTATDTLRAIEQFETQSALARLRPILERFWGAVDAGDRGAMCREIDAYGTVLDELAGPGAGGRRIAELVDAARALGFAAKGSGAVGGDCAIAVAFPSAGESAVDFAPLKARWRAAGAEPLPVVVDAQGVRMHGENAHA